MYNFVLSLFGGPSTPAAPHSAPTAHSLPTTDAPHTQPHTQPQTQPHTQPHTHTRRHSVALTGGIAGLTSASSSATDRPHSILTNHGRGSLDGLPPSAAHQSNTTMSSLQSMMQSSLQSTMQSSLQSAANSRDSSRRSSALSPMPAFATDPSLAHDAAFMSDSALEESLWREWLILGHMGTLQDRMEPSQAALPRFIHANPPRAVRNSASSTALSSIATASSTSSSTPTSSSTSTSAPTTAAAASSSATPTPSAGSSMYSSMYPQATTPSSMPQPTSHTLSGLNFFGQQPMMPISATTNSTSTTTTSQQAQSFAQDPAFVRLLVSLQQSVDESQAILMQLRLHHEQFLRSQQQQPNQQPQPQPQPQSSSVEHAPQTRNEPPQETLSVLMPSSEQTSQPLQDRRDPWLPSAAAQSTPRETEETANPATMTPDAVRQARLRRFQRTENPDQVD
eukprot:TRINITY_DN2278_c0_g1_i4.p1 TRINITY_DN2278_c0_g1~~TRINITY_DN2278_c0_g1_i4.p1  ORF type:complete len:451 (+),score=112.03 TRINITY_DN2278_c0_g1_i4:147-1499(+)